MTKIRKFTLLFFICIFSLSWGQEQAPQQSLRQIFNLLEAKFSCTFSYRDIDLNGHISKLPNCNTLDECVKTLSDKTLLNFSILADNTVAVSKKQNLLDRCIKVINAETNLPFENVAIITPYQQLITGIGGDRSFQLQSTNEVIAITYTGFETMKLRASNIPVNECFTIQLKRKVEYLSTIKLSNYLAKGITKNSDGSLNVNYQEFDILPGLIEPDVLQTIQALPGIQSVNETVSFINIRGGTNDQNLILLDGIKMYQSGHFFGLISAFNPFLTNEVNIIKNGSSAEYGDGVSGIISMEGKNDLTTEAKVGWGINLISTDAFVDIPLGSKASIAVAGRKSFNNLLETPTYTSYFDKAFQNTEVVRNTEAESASNDEFTFYDAHLRLVLEPSPKDYFRANFLLVGNKLDFLENATVDDEAQSRRSELLQENIAGGLYYRRNWNDQFSTDVQFYGTTYNLRSTNFDIINAQRLMQENDVLESGLKARAKYKVSESLNINGGYQFNETGITNFEQINNPFFERTDKQVLRTNSVFTEANWIPEGWNTNIIGGVRLNHVSKFDEVLIEPRLVIQHRFLKYFTIDFGGEFKSQTTSQIIDLQNDFLGVENRRWVLAKEDQIPILKGKQVSLGLSYSRNGWLVNVEPYLKEVDGITSQSQGFQNQFENVRTNGSYKVEGVDVLLNKRFTNVNTWLSYSWAKNDYFFSELTPSEFHNNIDIRHTFTYGINYSLNKFVLSAGFNWHSGKPVTPLVANNPISDGVLNFDLPNSANIDDYIRVDVSGTYKFNIGKKIKGFAGIAFWNLLDTNNELNRFYRINSDGAAEQVIENALSFTPNATLRLSF